ncbi:class I SAM-dependent methyltransferase [Solidesulfovibrio alcoholivorans]|uniref:class I SAM-dependent methyltransferase n=1 Tax=Solidesulfovibrio alcoholivorans TaxID=81406 RepID=UPI0004981F98|nr:class I SAM-dependent methyltransferase [Solidesulfovibrio alcoholivorans]
MMCPLCAAPTGTTRGYGRTFYACPLCGHLFTRDYDETQLRRGMGMEGSWSGPGGGGYREYCLVKILEQLCGMKSFLLFGTGNTPTLARLLAEGVDVVGCDISPDVVAYKKSVHGEERFDQPDALPGGRLFDGIVAVEVIEHFVNPLESFGLLFSCLAPEGIVAGTTDFYPGGPIEDANRYMSHKGHVAYWSQASLQTVAARFDRSVTAFEMVRPGSILPDEKFRLLWPNKRVFFMHGRGENGRRLRALHHDMDILDINMP